ncbi:MAG: hypothetical protein V1926_02595 [Candidatus Peregrinibacteria bacterium]
MHSSLESSAGILPQHRCPIELDHAVSLLLQEGAAVPIDGAPYRGARPSMEALLRLPKEALPGVANALSCALRDTYCVLPTFERHLSCAYALMYRISVGS